MEVAMKEDLAHAVLNENMQYKIHTASEDPGVHLVLLQSINLWDTLLRAPQSFNHIANPRVTLTPELDLNKTDSIKCCTPVLSEKVFKYYCVKRARQL